VSWLPLLLLTAASWPQKVRAVEKQGQRLQEHSSELAVLCSDARAQGRPHALAALRSEAEALRSTVDRLDASVRALSKP